jgi:hypothetical protein
VPTELHKHSVTIKFQNWGHKKHPKKDKKYLLIPSLNIVSARFRTAFTSLIQRIESQENDSSHIAFSSLVTVCWNDEAAANLVPFIAISDLGNKKSAGVDEITRGSLVSPKTRKQRPKKSSVHRREEDTRTHFPETQA